MTLEVGKLVAKIELEGSFDKQLAKARGDFEATAQSAERLDTAVGKAGASGKKLDVPAKAKDSLDKTAASAAKTDEGLKRASTSGKNLTVSDQPKRQLSETASVADQVDSRFKNLGITMKGLAATAGAAGLGATLFKGWDRITAIDTAQGKLRGLGHDAENVTSIMDNSLNSVKGTAFGLGDAAGIAAAAVAAGIRPGKELERTLKLTGDAATIAGQDLNSMGSIINKVATADMMQMDVANQMMDAGIPILQMVGDQLGVTADEARKMASDGKVSFETFQAALEDGLGGAALAAGDTLVGSLSNVGAAIGRLGAEAIEPFKDEILDAAAGATGFADTLASAVGPAASVAASGLGGVADIVGAIPGPITAATAALVALKVSGLGASMAGAAATAGGALRGVGETMALGAMYAKDSVAANGLAATSMSGLRTAAGGLRTGLGSVVNMLGGPYMVGIAAAGIAIGDIISSINRANEAQKNIAESASRAATAHHDLALAVGLANGEMTDTAVAAAQSIIEESITSTSAAAEQASGMLAGLGNWVDQTTIGYDGMNDALDGNVSALDRSRIEGRVNEMQLDALKEAANGLGIEMDNVASIAQQGGPRWDELREAIAAVGPEGEDMAHKLQAAADAANATAEAARAAEDGSYQLAESFRVLGDEAATVEDKTKALTDALDALAGEQMTADEAMGKHYETVRKLEEGMSGLVSEGENLSVMLDNGKAGFDMSTESGSKLRDSLLDLRKSHADAALSGKDLATVNAETDRTMKLLADATGLTVGQLWEMSESIGFIPSRIETMVAFEGAGQVLSEIGTVATALEGIPTGKEITIPVASDEAIGYLQSVGWEVEKLPDGKNMTVTASTEAARTGLVDTATAAVNLDSLAPHVQVDTNAEWVTEALGITAETTEGLPDGHIEITDTTDTNLQRLANLGIEVSKDKNGRVLINDADVERARGNVNSLSSIVTTSRHRVNVEYSNPDFAGAGGSSGYADGGFHGRVQSFADGGHRLSEVSGFLPDQAMVAAPHGTGGLVQWAEAETGGEAFIPLAPSKRQRSLAIWAQTGQLLGAFAGGGLLPPQDGIKGDVGGILAPMLASFADGGIMAAGLINLAKGVEGKPYVWGGVNWGDCSGAVSALANYVSGRSPFGSRFATGNQRQALSERGFKSGKGGAGDLSIGWFNGGPYGGHTSATLPNGVNFEMGGGRGNGQYGGSAAPASHSQYNQHAHFPMSQFADIDSAVTGDAMSAIGAELGLGNPDMPNDPGSPSATALTISTTGAGAAGAGTPVYVTNWPGSGGSGATSGASGTVSATIADAGGGFIEGMSIAGMIANATGNSGAVKVEQFANGGFSGIENHTAHITPAGSWRIFGEPETGGEAYIPLASHKRARSADIWAETGKRLGLIGSGVLGAGISLAGSLTTGQIGTSFDGFGLSDLGIDGGALQQNYAAQIESAAQQMVSATLALISGVGQNVDATLAQVTEGNDMAGQIAREQIARAML